MEWLADNWPVVLVALAVALVVLGLVQRLLKLAFIGVALAVIGFAIWSAIGSPT